MSVMVGTATVGFVGYYTQTVGSAYPVLSQNVAWAVPFLSGTGAGQANTYLVSSIPLATGTTSTFDIYGGVTDSFGIAVSLTKLKGLLLRNQSVTSGESLTLGGNFCSTALGFAALTLQYGGVVSFIAPNTGYTVTNSSADTITVQNANATTVTYDIVMWGIQ